MEPCTVLCCVGVGVGVGKGGRWVEAVPPPVSWNTHFKCKKGVLL